MAGLSGRPERIDPHGLAGEEVHRNLSSDGRMCAGGHLPPHRRTIRGRGVSPARSDSQTNEPNSDRNWLTGFALPGFASASTLGAGGQPTPLERRRPEPEQAPSQLRRQPHAASGGGTPRQHTHPRQLQRKVLICSPFLPVAATCSPRADSPEVARHQPAYRVDPAPVSHGLDFRLPSG
jgi:hypothetical protein